MENKEVVIMEIREVVFTEGREVAVLTKTGIGNISTTSFSILVGINDIKISFDTLEYDLI
jgi:hypothetical protein